MEAIVIDSEIKATCDTLISEGKLYVFAISKGAEFYELPDGLRAKVNSYKADSNLIELTKNVVVNYLSIKYLATFNDISNEILAELINNGVRLDREFLALRLYLSELVSSGDVAKQELIVGKHKQLMYSLPNLKMRRAA